MQNGASRLENSGKNDVVRNGILTFNTSHPYPIPTNSPECSNAVRPPLLDTEQPAVPALSDCSLANLVGARLPFRNGRSFPWETNS